MIKVKQNTFRSVFKIKHINNLLFNSLGFRDKQDEEKEFINFATDDFLGINRKFRQKGHVKHQSINTFTEGNYVINSLQKIFNSKLTFFPDETMVQQEILNQIIKQNDLIVLDELVNPTLKLAVKQLHYNKILTVGNNDLEKLEELVNTQYLKGHNIWYVAQSVYPVPGTAIPIKKINILLRKYNHLFCYIDESYGLSWSGTGGRGLILENVNSLEKLVVSAYLTKGFGANAGAVAISNNPEFSLISKINEIGSNIQSLSFAADLHNSDELILLQSQLQENISYYHGLIGGHLPCISNPELPVSFVAGGLPEVCHEICSQMLKEGFYVSPAIFPHASIKQPGIKINISASQTKKHIKNMTDALKQAYNITLKKRNKTLTDLLENKN